MSVLDALRDELQLPQERLLALAGISTRTLFRRRKTGRLDPRESDQVVRLVTVLDAAGTLFEGDRKAARHWLMRPVKGLGDVAPLELLDSEAGAREVLNLKGGVALGVALAGDQLGGDVLDPVPQRFLQIAAERLAHALDAARDFAR